MEFITNFLFAFLFSIAIGFLLGKYPKLRIPVYLTFVVLIIVVSVRGEWNSLLPIILGVTFGDSTGKWIAKKTQKTPTTIEEKV